ncbi:methyltransferase, FxLD system [Nocardiopsis sp. RSe5-2]|uniref:Protein-L-isoaspartate O-methyltransferase n=1 Tax=Nocardiopsis endophytica TaxID=3018445 RepID=A0ABT4U1P0_9ACTN|nr:methyltransferase, FxLD system [Nocardiopsis endophytica]MDA2810873.1 methyltransferase, FxLD system [Nocardiopsis endophytica]
MSDQTGKSPAAWRQEMVATLKSPEALNGMELSPPLERALLEVPRHLFAPEADLEAAHAPFNPVVTKKDERGVALSSVSAPQIQAMMLGQARIEPGMRVLEIGSGGYNAALIAELVGPAGHVVSIDIDPEVTERAAKLLAEAGYPQVRVVTGDAAEGVPGEAPFDRIIVTAGAWDIPSAWTEQLAEDGRLVVPLRMRSLTRSVAFHRSGGRLVSDSALVCGFVAMQGVDAHDEQVVLVNGDESVGLRFGDGAPGEVELLDNAVRSPRTEAWTGVRVHRQEPIVGLQLYLATHLPGFCIMTTDSEADTGAVQPTNPYFSMAAVRGDSFAYLITRPAPGDEADEHVEYGVHAFGPHRTELADEVTALVTVWDRLHRGGPDPQVTAYPAATPDEELEGQAVIDKRHVRVTLTWPPE